MSRARREIAPPKIIDTSRLCSAQHVRWYVAKNPAWEYLTDAQLGETLGLSAGYVGMILSGARPPTMKFLKAIGWESVTLAERDVMIRTLRQIAAMDAQGIRADDLGRAARLAAEGIAGDVGTPPND